MVFTVNKAASVTVIVTEKVPVTVGVPLNKPALERVMPVGKELGVVVKVYGAVPPYACRVVPG